MHIKNKRRGEIKNEESFNYYNSSSSESFNSISLSAALFLGSPYSGIATPLLESCPYENGKNLLTDLYLACFFLAQRSLTAAHTLHITMSSATQSTRDRSTIRMVNVLLWGVWMVIAGGALVERAEQGGNGRPCDFVVDELDF